MPEQLAAPESADDLRERVLALQARLRHRCPDVDPNDLLLILQSLLRPAGSGRRFFLRELGKGVYVP